MIIKINKKKVLISAGVLFAVIICTFTLSNRQTAGENLFAGGSIHPPMHCMEQVLPVVSSQQDDLSSERFQRPSKELPYKNPFTFGDFNKNTDTPPLISKKFDRPEAVLLAYYGILQEASNMLGFSGGCGSIGQGELPYPYAYELLTKETQKKQHFNKFKESFEGIGYITLLKVVPAAASPGTPETVKYYMVELEVITGEKARTDEQYNQGSRFAYYYGLVTVENTEEEGWKIKDIAYIPEDFLCAPTHSWFYLSDAIVQIVYGDNLKIIDTIDRIEQKGNMVYVYASKNGRQYRFDFIRLTNGYDILLHENSFIDRVWEEVEILPEQWSYLKLTPQNSMLKMAV